MPTRDPPSRPHVALIAGYVVAVLSVLASLLALWGMNRVFQSAAPVSVFLCAVMFSAWFGGFKAGLLAIGLSVLAFDHYFLPPISELRTYLDELPRLVLFALAGLFGVSLTAAQRSAARSLSQAHENLQKRSRELERINVALHAENVERERAEYLTRQVFETLPDGVAIIGRDYRYQRVNQVYERYFDVPREKLLTMGLAELVDADVFEFTRNLLDKCFAGGEVRNAGWWLQHPLGRRYMAVTYSPLRPQSDRVEAALVISRDLTEHIAAPPRRCARRRRSSTHVTRVTTLGEVTASFAHEVNQPLAAIVNNANACLGLLPAGRPIWTKCGTRSPTSSATPSGRARSSSACAGWRSDRRRSRCRCGSRTSWTRSWRWPRPSRHARGVAIRTDVARGPSRSSSATACSCSRCC